MQKLLKCLDNDLPLAFKEFESKFNQYHKMEELSYYDYSQYLSDFISEMNTKGTFLRDYMSETQNEDIKVKIGELRGLWNEKLELTIKLQQTKVSLKNSLESEDVAEMTMNNVRSLSKDIEENYQSIMDTLAELKELAL